MFFCDKLSKKAVRKCEDKRSLIRKVIYENHIQYEENGFIYNYREHKRENRARGVVKRNNLALAEAKYIFRCNSQDHFAAAELKYIEKGMEKLCSNMSEGFTFL